MEWNGIWNGTQNGMEWINGTAAWNRSLEQMQGTYLEPKCVPIMHMEIWNTLSGTAAWNGSLEQMHGAELEPKYFCLEQLHGTEVWNRCMEQS